MKDLESYKKHNLEYESDKENIKKNVAIIDNYNENKIFERMGFKKAIDITRNLPKIHIDIGSGIGWLLMKTSPFFNKVIGIEPSTSAIETAKKITKEENIDFINKDMVDGITELNIKEPVFITTSIVLSHIQDYYVKEFLELLNKLPNDSVIYFDERYDKNIQWPFWYIRDKNWWASNLKDWNLTFFELKNSGYKSGIYGIKVGEDNVKNRYGQNVFQKILWKIQGIYYKNKRFIIDKIKIVFKK